MKIKPAKGTGGIVVETKAEERLPFGPIPEIHLRRIIVPTDFSECSRKALHYGKCFARQFASELIALHVVETVPAHMLQPTTGLDPVPGQFVPGDMSDVAVSMRNSAQEKLALLQEEFGGEVTLRNEIRDGTSHTEIVEAARQLDADLIVLGTHGRTGLKRALLGSTAEKVVRHAPCPVMVVRLEEHDFVDPMESAQSERNEPIKPSVFV